MKKLLCICLILCLGILCACGDDKAAANTPDNEQLQQNSGQNNSNGSNKDQNTAVPPDNSQNKEPDPSAKEPLPLEWSDHVFTGTFSDETLTKDPLVLLTVNLPRVTAAEDIELYYQNKLDRIKEQAQTTYLDLARGNYTFAREGIGIFAPVVVEHDYKVVRNDGKLFSVYREIYENTGGAHPSITLAFETFRVSDGARMIFSDMFTVPYEEIIKKLQPLIEEQMDKNIKEYGAEYYFENAKNDLFDMWDKNDWCITDDQLIMCWQTYAISPYVAGVQEFYIPLDSVADIIDAQWIS